MKVIYPDKITAIAASASDAEYPALYLSDEHIKRPWKSTGNTGTLTISVDGGTGIRAIGMFETNAIQAVITIRNATDTADIIPAVTYDTGATSWYSFITGGGDYFKNIWHEYSATIYAACESAHKIKIALTASAGVQVYCGVIRSGQSREFRNPQYGLSEGLKDFSVIKELNNGARYTRKRDIPRTFSGKFMVDRDPDFYQFMHDVAQTAGPIPLAWLLYDDGATTTSDTENRWAVFAYFDSMPSGSHAYYQHSEIDFALTEAI